MPRSPKSSDISSSSARPLVERVRERVDRAAATLGEERKVERRGAAVAKSAGSGGPREMRALRRVFREMGRTQRTTRHQTGQAPSPVVRDAARAFRRDPSMTALVLVAASLDEVGLLTW
jgi:hypothetical protein